LKLRLTTKSALRISTIFPESQEGLKLDEVKQAL